VAAVGIEEEAVQDLVSPPSGAPLFSAMGDVTGFRHDDLTAPPATMFTAPVSGNTSSIDFAELNPSFLVRVGPPNASATPAVHGTGFTFSGGSSWFQGNADPPGVANGGTIAAAANASRVLWSDPGAGVSFSTDNGNSWTASTGIPTGARVASDRVNPMKFYGFANGTFYVSANGGASFTAAASTGLPPAGTSVRFRAVPGHEGDIWLAGGSDTTVYGLWHSTNSGTTFAKLTGPEKADVVGFGMPAPAQTYVALFISGQIGGVRGIYRSDNAGSTWVRINDDQHQYGITGQCMTGDPRVYGRVYFCTNGRGIIVGDIAGSPAPDFSFSASPATLSINQGASGTSTITITRTGGFTGSVSFLSATGLPSGVTATFSPVSTTGTSSTLTLAATGTAATGTATVLITATSGAISHTVSIVLTVGIVVTPDFSLSASPTPLAVNQGSTGTATIAIARVGAFAGSVSFTASGLPTGVTATFAPSATTGASASVTFAAPATATPATATVTVTGVSGALSHSATLTLTISAPPPPDFSISASPASLTVTQGSSATSTLTITRTNGFAGAVSLSAPGLPAGVTATFSANSVTGTSSTLTVAASATAATGAVTLTISGTSGALTHAVSIPLTVNPAVSGTGGVTVTTVINSNSSFFDDEGVKVSNTAAISALSLTITMQNTSGLSFSGQYNTVGGSITQSHSNTASAITYQFALAPGQTIGPGTNYLFDAQAGGSGTAHPTAGDTYTITYTTGGKSFTQSGNF